MPQNYRYQQKRALNLVRKRRAELDLLLNSDDREWCDNITDQKRAKRAKTEYGSETPPTYGTTPTTSGSSTTTVISREALQICDAGAAEKARELGKELRQQRPKSVVFESKLQLHKLNGKTLSERELAAFLHRQMLGSLNTPNRSGANWLRFEGGRRPLQIVLVRVNCADSKMLRSDDNAKFIDEYFGFKWVRMHQSACDRNRFWLTISTTTHSLRELLMRKIKEFGDPLLSMRVPERKAQLLMSLADMTHAKYPFPTSVFEEDLKIRATRANYRRVSERSPIFVLDCEMCLTTEQRLELTRISMVNEAGETLIDELVKPHNKIVDYITFKSGITEKMLHNVHTRLKDIQTRICALLTDDAILCGHSLENDLLALRLSHPFCIDTSMLFNFSGRPNVRSGLKALADIFLNEQIQNSSRGHCSLQDARATLKLLKLKLEKGLVFGNVALGWNFAKWAADAGMSVHGTRLNKAGKAADQDGHKEDEDGKGTDELDSTLLSMTTVEDEITVGVTEDGQMDEDEAVPVTTVEEERVEGEPKESEENVVEKEIANGEEISEAKEETERDEEEKISSSGGGEGEKGKETKENLIGVGKGNDEGRGGGRAIGEKEGETVLEDRGAREGKESEKTSHSRAEEDEATKCAHQKAREDTDKSPEFFDFNEAVRIDNAMQQTSTLSDCFNSVHGVGHKNNSKKILVVGRKMDQFFQKNESCVLTDLSGDGKSGQLSTQFAHLSASLMEYEVALIDLDFSAGTDKRELDDAFRHLVGGMCNNSLCLMLMVGMGNKEEDKPILYQRIHHKTKGGTAATGRTETTKMN